MNGRISTRSSIVRFMLKVHVNKLTGCWEWNGSNSGRGRGGGYGRFSDHCQTVAAHRWSYVTFKGPIRKRAQIDHLCNNRSCVNPDHLECVSHKVNQKRRNKRMNSNEDRTEL